MIIEKQEVRRQKVKKTKIILGVFILVLGIILLALLARRISSDKKITELLNLGNKYLTEQDYEQAIVTFQEIIGIEPKCEEAYKGLADVYVAMGDYESAIDTLQTGIEQTGSEELAAYLTEIEETYARLQEEKAQREREEAEATKREEEEAKLTNKVAIREIWHRVEGYEGNGDFDLVTVTEMNAKGTTLKVIWYYDYPENVQELQEYENGELMHYTHYDGEGGIGWEGETECEYEYDEEGKITTAIYYSDGVLSSIDEYGPDGRIAKTSGADMDGEIVSHATYEYDEDGNVTRSESVDLEGTVYWEEEHEYDELGRMVSNTIYSYGELAREDTYLWECENEAGETETVDLYEKETIDGIIIRETFYNEKGEVIKENLYQDREQQED